MDKRYEKPVILAAEDMAEGVFAGSGSQSLTISNLSVTRGNEWYKTDRYDFDLTNTSGTDLTGWSYTFNVTTGNATGVLSRNKYSAEAMLSGNRVVIIPGSGTATLSAGASAVQIQIEVSYDSTSFEMK